MELLKTILDFVAKVAYPVILGIAFVLFRKQLGGILKEFGGILLEVKERRLRLSFQGLELDNPSPLAVASLQEVQNAPDLASAAKTIQKLLSPAAPLALGYVKNFVEKMKKSESGIQIEVVEDTTGQKFETIKSFTIHIPEQLTDSDSSSTNLVRDKYPGAQIKNISIQSATGRPFTGLAVLHGDRLYPVDVPQTVTSIRHVFKFRGDELKGKGKMKPEEIEKLENENLDEFANIIEKKIEDLQLSEYVRVIRRSSELFPPVRKAN